MTNQEFAEWFRKRTFTFSVQVVQFCKVLPYNNATKVVSFQLIKSATSIAANYRAACRARSGAEFFAKLCIVVEEADEAQYWLELIQATGLSDETVLLKALLVESGNILAIATKAKFTAGKNSDKNGKKAEEPLLPYSPTPLLPYSLLTLQYPFATAPKP